jgi:hypothetical protein
MEMEQPSFRGFALTTTLNNWKILFLYCRRDGWPSFGREAVNRSDKVGAPFFAEPIL